jgi:glycine/D-amino acid oxidase-like deaminating enzyme/nitrite reductase/ring-hydroxylating ferredoxin subunit
MDASAEPDRNPSWWNLTAPRPQPERGRASGRYDVVVAGAGIAGLTTAHLLASQGARVAVLERRRVGAGTTGHTTAKVSALQGTIYSTLVGAHGAEVAAAYAAANLDALAAIAETVADLQIDCDFTRAPAATYAPAGTPVDVIEAEAEAARSAGLDVEMATSPTGDLPFPIEASVSLADQAHLHPMRYLAALVDSIIGQGSSLLESTAVLDVEEEDGGVTVMTDHGTVDAEIAVITTLLPIADRGGFFARTRPSRSYALAARVDGPPVRAMYLSVEDPPHSIRPLVTDDGPAVVLGGSAHVPGTEGSTERCYAELERWAREAFPGAVPLARWSAQDYASADSLPFAGRMPWSERTYVATGFGKWGLTNGTAAAAIIADQLNGRANPFAEVYDATRIGGLSHAAGAARINASVAKRLVAGKVARLAAPGVRDLAPGAGQVVKSDRGAVAAFRDSEGVVHALDAACTHLGCEVRFNDAERSWDCPCHGSRFGLDGQVLEGPAVDPLGQVDVEEPSAT